MPVIERQHKFEDVTSQHVETVKSLVAKFSELQHINPEHIIVVMKEKGPKRWTVAKVSRIPDRWIDILEQSTGRFRSFVIELYADQWLAIDASQQVLVLYRELRRINREFKVVNPDIVEWEQLYRTCGKRWAEPDQTVPNLLDDGVDWKVIMGADYVPPEVR